MDLVTRYMGLELKNPLVASASPVMERLDAIRRIEDAGAGAIVLFSLFEEQIRRDAGTVEEVLHATSDRHGEASSYFPTARSFDVGLDAYLELIRGAREAVDIPVIASLNGTTERGWTDFAGLIQQAGASALELNIYYIPTEIYRTGRQVEERYMGVFKAVRTSVTIPIAVKIGPYFSSLASMAGELDHAGVDALALFNRFYQPDFDIENRVVVPSLSLSRPDEIRLPLMWIALLYGRLRASLAATTGVHSAIEMVKYLMAGADVVMTTSAVLMEGPAFINRVLAQTADWMSRHGYSSVSQLRGCMSHELVGDPTALVRTNYIRSLGSYQLTGAW